MTKKERIGQHDEGRKEARRSVLALGESFFYDTTAT
jgi:hypothetical protein